MNRFDTFSVKEIVMTSHSGQQFDLRENMVETHIFSSIIDISISAQLFIHDSFNIIENAPIVGGESVRLKWRTEGRNDYSVYDFKIYKIGRRTTEDTIQGFVLYLTTADAYNDANISVSQAFKGEYSVSIPKVLNNLGTTRPIDVDVTSGSMARPFISPNWSPLQISKWMANRAMDDDGNPVFFYEDEDGYKFRTVSSIYNQPIWSTFVYEPQETFEYSQERTIHNIASFAINNSRNAMANSLDGLYDTELSVYDFRKKTIDVQHKTYSQSSAPQVDVDKLDHDVNTDRIHRRFIETQSDRSHEGDYHRRLVNLLMDQFSITAVLAGDSDMRIGNIIEFDVPATEPLNRGIKQKEERNSGRFLISAIKTTLTRQNCTMGITICKDSQRRVRR